MDWFELANNIGVFGIVVAAVSLLARAAFKQMLSRDLEKFKSNLEKDAITHRIRYEQLHGERVAVIKEVYKKIVQSHRSLRSLINIVQWSGESPVKEKAIEASRDYTSLMTYYDEHRIFFEERHAKKVDSLLKIFRDAANKFELSILVREGGEYKEARRVWDDAWEQIDEQAPILKIQLENSFRGILGIENQAVG
ncbi:MAG: hypothetical protein J7J98_09120 [candidate division Zixibacteria bacterium]|nr:hypothetical protein [candidate division Zixibacteria bacterium]